ncbi:MAG: calcium/sodium antiporter [Paludibacter sp.]|nr:calcium/sodium antiporter [Paludibacter sp.]MDD4198530.1 calcium/sodium antiporter [Paludibacter sp.]MDD4427988.1 calcium/sodium antiporter [Paludibacter sp.]
MIDYFLIIAGFVLLIFGANYLVDGSGGLAKRFNISNLIIGLTIVAFGTSAPELVVNLVAAVNPGTTDIALTNIIGSNMINTYIILGATAVVFPIASQKSSRRFDIPLSLIAPVAVLLLSLNGVLSQIDGLVLLLFFGWFMYSNIKNVILHPEEEQAEDYKPMKIWKATLLIVGGLAALVVGAQLIVPAASNIATRFGVSQSVIGLTIVALGTSLPELATSVVAAFKKNSDIALGNVIGSNIFNVFFILASSAIITPLPTYQGITIDLIITATGSLLVLLFIYSNKERVIKRWGGVVFLMLYTAFLIWKISTLN